MNRFAFTQESFAHVPRALQSLLNKVHLGKTAQQPFTILETMNSILYPGRFTLLLGPPGAGKSTLLNALAGRLHKSSRLRLSPARPARSNRPRVRKTQSLRTACNTRDSVRSATLWSRQLRRAEYVNSPSGP